MRLMDVPNEVNVELEAAFGIDMNSSNYYSSTINPRFSIIADAEGPLFVADDEYF